MLESIYPMGNPLDIILHTWAEFQTDQLRRDQTA